MRQAFADLQTAVRERNGDKLYDLLSSDRRSDADRLAGVVKETYAQADDQHKQDLARKKIGLPAAKLQALDGKRFLESDLFYNSDEHDEIPDVKQLDKVEVKADTAKVYYPDPDNPKATTQRRLVREENRWRFDLSMPRVPE